nr:helix-turn-helix domain-containing protein [Enterococcus hirae]
MVSTFKTIDSIVMEIAKDTIVYKLIDEIYRGRIHSFQTATEQFHLSHSVLRKTIRHINKELKFYRLTLSTKQLDLLGNEADIRYFLFEFYHGFRQTFTTNHSYQTINNTYEELQEATTQIATNYFRINLWMNILKQRLLNKQMIHLEPSLCKEIKARTSFIQFKSVFKKYFKSRFGITQVAEEEIVWSYLIRLHCVSYYPANKTLNLCYPEDIPTLEQYEPFLRPLQNSTTITNVDLLKLKGYLSNLRLLTKISSHFERITLELHTSVPMKVKKLFKEWQNYLKKYTHVLPFSVTHYQDIALTLSIIHYANLTSSSTQKKQTILFSFQGEPGLEDYLTRFVCQLLPQNVVPLFISNKFISHKMVLETEVALVVCNYDFLDTTFPCPVLLLSYFPTKKEWLDLQQYIFKLAYPIND